MKKVLLFGFEPFSEFKENPSEILTRQLDGAEIGSSIIKGKILPVSYSETGKIIRETIKKERPDLAIGTGLAPGRSKISVEKIAVNYKRAAIADNYGKTFEGMRINSNPQDGIFSTLDCEGIVKGLNREGIPSELSLTAGAYLCNLAMFTIIEETSELGSKGGFVHLPCHKELISSSHKLNYPSMDLKDMKKAISYIIRKELKTK